LAAADRREEQSTAEAWRDPEDKSWLDFLSTAEFLGRYFMITHRTGFG
jgi:hypothetical protein